MLDEVDLVLVMSVNPGFGGQNFIASQLRKIEAIANRIAKAVSTSDSRSMAASMPTPRRLAISAGANVLVAGTAAFRGGPGHMPTISAALRGERMSARRLGGRARRRPQARARLAAFAARARRASR